jgi:DNA-binding NtrC family response regulator
MREIELKLESSSNFTQACRMALGEGRRVLVVDDDTGVLRIMREALQNFLQCEVDTSPSPEYAFELALKKSYDLMIFDFSMPLIDGTLLFHLISKVYENATPIRQMPPLLLVSGQGGDERAQELLKEARVCGFLPKPFTINRLLEKVKACWPEWEQSASVEPKISAR